MDKKNAKITKPYHAYKGYASSSDVDILNPFNPKLQLKDTESATRNKLGYLLIELRGSKFVATLVIEIKILENNDVIKYTTFYSNPNVETIINEMTLIMYLNQSLPRLNQSYKNIFEKVWAGLLIQ